jgi:hypothetical protein
MGKRTSRICTICDTRFSVSEGGGFFFDLLHCDACGAARSVSHEALGDIHLGYVKGLGIPYAIARAGLDAAIRATYPGEPLTQEEYRAGAEATLDPCTCGGRFRYDAPGRCPTCRSTSEQWTVDPKGPRMLYD